MVIPVDIIVAFFMATLVYYTVLFFVSKKDPGHRPPSSTRWGFVILIPAHNEERVISETVRRAAALRIPAHIIVINDGSNDATETIAQGFVTNRVHLLNRRYPNAKKGKGEALNHAYSIARSNYTNWFPDLSTDRIIITVLDADGYLDEPLFSYVAGMMEQNAMLGGVQTPVTIQNPERSLWLRMQDLEFVGFSCFVQQARHWLSSIGLGGNGQFIRASEIEKLGDRPWNSALSEDLDIGIRLLLEGEELGYCNMGFVHQQGLTKLRPLLKQRTRWVQGHYQAWKYLPRIWKSNLRLSTKLDLSLYLLLIVSVLIIIGNTLLTGAVLAGSLSTRSVIMNSLFEVSPYFGRIAQIILSLGPALLFAFTYNKYSRSRVPLTSWLAIIVIFCAYGWIWVYASLAAITRIVRRKNNWVKTERNVMTAESLNSP
jgi:1,2-diacylglycerol 3-beta-glucosyltransferase